MQSSQYTQEQAQVGGSSCAMAIILWTHGPSEDQEVSRACALIGITLC